DLRGLRGDRRYLRRSARPVVLAEDLGDFWTSEFERQVTTRAQDFPHLAPGEVEPMLRLVGARPRRNETSARAGEKSRGENQGNYSQLDRLELIEELLRSERAVEAAHACVIAPDDEVRDAVVLPDQRVEDRFARPGVAHRRGECREQRPALGIVVFEQQLVG